MVARGSFTPKGASVSFRHAYRQRGGERSHDPEQLGMGGDTRDPERADGRRGNRYDPAR